MEEDGQQEQQGLYESRFEHDACGVGFVANIDGRSSRSIVTQGIQILGRLLHRGAVGGDAGTGDGAGVMIRIPDPFFRRVCGESGIDLPDSGLYGVGMIFMPPEAHSCTWCRGVLETVCSEMKLRFLGWREVPCDTAVLGEKARAECPQVMQCFIGTDGKDAAAFERRLYLLRKRVERRVSQTSDQSGRFYIVSLSGRTIVYKGLMMGPQIMDFYRDLHDDDMQSPFILVHQRYSTNTFPSWRLAQPFRYLAHNGEINTLQGNRNQMQAREKELACELFGDEIKDLFPIIEAEGSDSASLDNALELLVACGRDLAHSMMMLVPQAWGQKYPIGPDLRGFFEYHAGLMEPWDGPAALVFSDGERVGAMLDRNGLRPARYTITRDGLMVLASETGVLDLPDDSVVEKGALRPGEMILADLSLKRVIKDGELKTTYARSKPYRRWVDENKIVLHGFFNDIEPVAAETARPDQAPEALRVHPRGPGPDHRDHGRHGAGAGGIDGLRHAAGGFERAAAAPLLLLQADVRPGHQPADRLDPRGAGDVADDLHGKPGEHPGGRSPQLPADQAAPPAAVERGPGSDPAPQTEGFPGGHRTDGLPRGRRRSGAGGGPDPDVHADARCPFRHGAEPDHPLRPEPAGGNGPDPGAPGGRRDQPVPGAPGEAHRVRA